MINFSSLKSEIDRLNQVGIADNLDFINYGLEKEGLRQTPDGYLSKTSHPEALGSALTNSFITTDYSEALLEFITPVFKDKDCLREFLLNLHSFALKGMPENEKIWCHSMPCILTQEKDIPIADYGSSNIGMMKHIYRRGLGWRYSRRMQTIAGIHFNFSYSDNFWQFLYENSDSSLNLQDFKSAGYFNLIRNFQKYVWLLFYFNGASPALCKSFLSDTKNNLESLDRGTAYLPYATSLRMSDLGYTNKEQQSLNISFNNLSDYVAGLTEAIRTPSAEFEKIGVKVDGEYRQLNSNILQIENEFYSFIRPKRTANSGEMPSRALTRGGVEYIEVRMLDINPFDPVGISKEQIEFLDIFLLSCLLQPCSDINNKEWKCLIENQQRAIKRGRDPQLKLLTEEGEVGFKETAFSCLEAFKTTADLLDTAFATDRHCAVLEKYRGIVEDPKLTPSGKVLDTMVKENISYYPLAKDISNRHNDFFKNSNIPSELLSYFEETAMASHAQQREIEQNDTCSFDDFLNNYFNQ